MERLFFTANTDQLNRQNIICPANVLAASIEAAFEAADSTLGFNGFPTHVSHDWCRPIGWNIPLGIHIETGVARQMGECILPQTNEERQLIAEEQACYVKRITRKECCPFIRTLTSRADSGAEKGIPAYVAGAAGLYKIGLAATLYPRYFDETAGLVDKDGLVDYRTLRAQCVEIQPGIFHDPSRDLLLFAHPYLRRSLSRLNTLNTDLLSVLAKLANESPALSIRLRLDPDIVGHPDVKTPIELEYWRGPHFSDDITSIPSGVAEHRASQQTRFFEGIDRTQFWWKAEDGGRRTFEAEEIRDEPSLGVSEEYFGCRYVHSEYSPTEDAITHFDGAIRGYSIDDMVTRLDLPIDRAGKHSNYTKLFRVDGPLTIGAWKNAVVEYFRGNDLVPEYFGSPARAINLVDGGQSPSELSLVPPYGQVMIGYIDRQRLQRPPLISILPTQHIGTPRGSAAAIDALPNVIADVFKGIQGYSDCVGLMYADGLLNLPLVILPDQNNAERHIRSIADNLLPAVQDEKSKIHALSLAFAWPMPRYWVLLSLAGDVQTIAKKLPSILNVASPLSPPSKWITQLKLLFSEETAPATSTSRLNVSNPALLRLKHNQTEVQFCIPEAHPKYEDFQDYGIIADHHG